LAQWFFASSSYTVLEHPTADLCGGLFSLIVSSIKNFSHFEGGFGTCCDYCVLLEKKKVDHPEVDGPILFVQH